MLIAFGSGTDIINVDNVLIFDFGEVFYDADTTAADIKLHKLGIVFVFVQYSHNLVGIPDRAVLQAQKILLAYIRIPGAEKCLDECSVDQDPILLLTRFKRSLLSEKESE